MVYYYPPDVYMSERGDETLYFSAARRVVVTVNHAGADVLKAAEKGGTASEIAARLSAGEPEAGAGVQELVKRFLDEMAVRRFLSTERCDHSQGTTGYPEPASLKLGTLYLHLTDACNLRCIYCYNACQRSDSIAQQHKSGLPNNQQLTDDEIRAVLDDAAEAGAGSVVFTGGEPLLRRHIFDLADYARSKGMSTSLLTNGSLVDREKAARIADLFDTVIVSLDSWVEKEHSTLRPGAPFHQVWDGIRYLSEAAVSSLAIRPVITTLNLKSLPEFPRVAKKQLNCTQFYPAVYLPNTPEELETLGLFPSPESCHTALESFSKALGEVGGELINDNPQLSGASGCGAAVSLLSISTCGDVYPCQSLHEKKFWSGNIRDHSLSDILRNAPALKSFRENRWPWFEPCKKCPLMSICTSTCRVFENVFNDQQELFFQKMCPFFKQECERKLWQEADKKEYR